MKAAKKRLCRRETRCWLNLRYEHVVELKTCVYPHYLTAGTIVLHFSHYISNCNAVIVSLIVYKHDNCLNMDVFSNALFHTALFVSALFFTDSTSDTWYAGLCSSKWIIASVTMVMIAKLPSDIDDTKSRSEIGKRSEINMQTHILCLICVCNPIENSFPSHFDKHYEFHISLVCRIHCNWHSVDDTNDLYKFRTWTHSVAARLWENDLLWLFGGKNTYRVLFVR